MIYYIENAFPIHLRRLDIMRFFRDEWSLKEYVVGYYLDMKYVINSSCSIVNAGYYVQPRNNKIYKMFQTIVKVAVH